MQAFYWIAQKINFKGNKTVSKIAMALAVLSVAVGVAVMEIATSVVNGFEKEIFHKLIGFSSAIQITTYLPEANLEAIPLQKDANYLPHLLKDPQVQKITPFIHLPVIIQSPKGIEGIMLKGVDTTWNHEFFAQYLKEGRLPDLNATQPYEVLISRKIANTLHIQTNQKIKLYFLGEKTRARVLKVVGIYETGLAEFDQLIAIASLSIPQKLLNWDETQIEGYDVFLKDPAQNINIAQAWDAKLPMDVRAKPIQELFPEIFNWIQLQHQNVQFILSIMMAIAILNMASAVIVRIIERSYMIGVLKALGMKPFPLRLIFLHNATLMILLGIFIGNFLAITLLYLQQTFQFLTFDPDTYFVYTVPIDWNIWNFLYINGLVLAVCTFAMFLPTYLIQSIQPVKAMKL